MQLFLTFIRQVWSFGQVWTADLLWEVTAICWRIMLSFPRANTYAPLSHQLSVHLTHCSCAVCVWCDGMRISQGRVTKREERDERKAKRWEEKRAIMQMWLNDVAVPRATVISSALSFIYYHTTAETVYILIDCKSQHTFTLIMAMTFNIGHPCQARCFADI